jgi:hypothetical protein
VQFLEEISYLGFSPQTTILKYLIVLFVLVNKLAAKKGILKEEAVERLDTIDGKISYSYFTGDVDLKDQLSHLLTLNGLKAYSYFRKIKTIRR